VGEGAAPRAEKTIFGEAEFMGVSCECIPRARVHTLGGEESNFYWAEKDAGV